MLTGRSPFDGGDVTSTLAKVIESEPSWQGVPLKLQRLLKKCLEKDPRKRLRDIGDAWELLADAPASSTTPSVRRWLWPSTAAVLALAALVALWLAVAPTEPASGPLIRLDMDLGPNVTLAKVVPELASSFPPTATRLAYYSGNPGTLFTRRLDEDQATELPGTEGDAPFFSPDGQWIGFTGGRTTKKVSVQGGAVIELAKIGGPGASWAENGDIFVGLSRIPASGGDSSQITKEPRPSASFGYAPQALPGGKGVLFTETSSPFHSRCSASNKNRDGLDISQGTTL